MSGKFPLRFVACVIAASLLLLSSRKLPAAEPVNLSYISFDTFAAVVVCPRAVLTDPALELLPREVAIAAAKQHLGIELLTVEQAIGTWGVVGLKQGKVNSGLILHFSTPYDGALVKKCCAENAEEVELRGKKYFRPAKKDAMCVAMPDERTLLLASEPTLKTMLSADKVDSTLVELLKNVDTEQTVSAAVDFATVRHLVLMQMKDVPAEVPEPYQKFLKLPELVNSIEAALDLRPGIGIKLRVGGADARDASAIKQLVDDARELLRQTIHANIEGGLAGNNDPTTDAMAQYALRFADRLLDDLKVAQDGNRVSIVPEHKMQSWATLPLLAMGANFFPFWMNVGVGRAEDEGLNDLKQIGLALHTYHDPNKQFPAAAIRDKEGKPLLSWRVAILPYLGEDELYKEFHLDEPWDSEHNRALIPRMPDVFTSPELANAEGRTCYLAVTGPNTILGDKEGIPLSKITDGTSNTILVVEVDEDQAVEWTKPQDFELNAEQPRKGLGGMRPNGFYVLFADGSARVLPSNIDGDFLKKIITYAEGEPADLNAIPTDVAEVPGEEGAKPDENAAKDQLKSISLALHVYAAEKKVLPPQAICDKEGKPLLSWRVAILPYIDQQELYKEFHLDEPWDSEHNLKLIPKMPAVFANPLFAKSDGVTLFLGIAGEGTVLGAKEGVALDQVKDGTSNTIMIVEADPTHLVKWTRPKDFEFDPEKPLKGLGELRHGRFHVALVDGSVRAMAFQDGELFKSLSTYAGGETIRIPAE